MNFTPRVAWLATSVALLSITVPGGELDPPGAPAPTPGPEARIPITNADLPLTANVRGGSYYFAESLSFDVTPEAAIVVTERFITIDLNGFALEGPGTAGGGANHGIQGTSNAREVRIINGSISGFGGDGVRLTARGGHVESVHVFDCDLNGINLSGDNGHVIDCTVQSCSDDGIVVGAGGLVEGCIARGNFTGIVTGAGSTVRSSVAQSNSNWGISLGGGSLAADCNAMSNSSDGIFTNEGCTVRGCNASNNSADGIAGQGGTLIVECTAEGNTMHGIAVNAGCSIVSCTSRGNTGNGINVNSGADVLNNVCAFNGFMTGDGAGIFVTGANSRIDGNHVHGNDRGIEVDTALNLITRNTASGGGQDDYGSIVGANNLATVQTDINSAGPWDNIQQ